SSSGAFDISRSSSTAASGPSSTGGAQPANSASNAAAGNQEVQRWIATGRGMHGRSATDMPAPTTTAAPRIHRLATPPTWTARPQPHSTLYMLLSSNPHEPRE